MNALDAVAWNTNWAWGLPLIALNVVIHVFGLGIFTEKVEHILTRLKSRRRFTSILAIVMSVTVVMATILHGVEGAVWAGAYRLLDALPDNKSAMLLPQCYDQLWARRSVFGKPVANDGCLGGIERNAPFWADDGILIRHDPKGLAHRKPGTGATLLTNVSANTHRAEGLASQQASEQTEETTGLSCHRQLTDLRLVHYLLVIRGYPSGCSTRTPRGWKMDQPRRRLSELTSQELSLRAIEYRRMAMTANGQTTILALNKLAIRFALLAARREIEEAASPSPDQDQSELDKLIRLAERAAADEPDPVRTLADIIKTVSEGDADPYLIIGVLVEGAVLTLRRRIPDERQDDTASAVLNLLADRLRDAGMPPGA